MKCLNLQDFQAKTHNYRKGLTYLKNRATTNQKNITLTKNDKKNTQAENNWRPSDHKKKRRKEKHRIHWKLRINMAIKEFLSWRSG